MSCTEDVSPPSSGGEAGVGGASPSLVSSSPGLIIIFEEHMAEKTSAYTKFIFSPSPIKKIWIGGGLTHKRYAALFTSCSVYVKVRRRSNRGNLHIIDLNIDKDAYINYLGEVSEIPQEFEPVVRLLRTESTELPPSNSLSLERDGGEEIPSSLSEGGEEPAFIIKKDGKTEKLDSDDFIAMLLEHDEKDDDFDVWIGREKINAFQYICDLIIPEMDSIHDVVKYLIALFEGSGFYYIDDETEDAAINFGHWKLHPSWVHVCLEDWVENSVGIMLEREYLIKGR